MRLGNPKVNGLSFSYDKSGILSLRNPVLSFIWVNKLKNQVKTEFYRDAPGFNWHLKMI